MRVRQLWWMAAAALALTGCGGGLNSPLDGNEQSHDFGNGFVGRSRGPMQFDTIPSTGAATFTTMFGGDLTFLGYGSGSSFFNQSRIVFRSERDGNGEIYAMNADGSGLVRLTNDAADDSVPSITADGQTVVFLSTRDGSPEIYRVSSFGGTAVRVTNNGVNEEFPCVSPDGTRIAYAATVGGNRDIYMITIDGSNPVRVTTDAADDTMPVFSPDGTRIAFTSYRSGPAKIWSIRTDGSNPMQLTYGAVNDLFPAYSPDGSKVLFERDGGFSARNFITAPVTGAGVETNITTDGASKIQPWFTPDGQKILYSAYGSSSTYELFIMNADGSNRVMLTFAPGNDSQPRCSGSMLARTYVGTAGSDGGTNPPFGSSRGAAVISQVGRNPVGVLGIDATTRSSLTMTSLFTGNQSQLVGALVSADAITYLAMDVKAGLAPTIIVGNSGVYSGPFTEIELFFDGASGQLVSVVPLTRSRSAGGDNGRPTIEGDRMTLHGDFGGAFNLTGRQNLAPNGATTIVIDLRTGRIIEAR